MSNEIMYAYNEDGNINNSLSQFPNGLCIARRKEDEEELVSFSKYNKKRN